MSNGNQYTVVLGERSQPEHFVHGIDLQQGWVKLNQNHISEIVDMGVLNEGVAVSEKARKELLEEHGEDVFIETED